jgi:hypothetical protein
MRLDVFLLLVLCLTAGPAASAAPQEEDVRLSSPAALRNWVDARAGTGDPVHWIADGAIYEYPSGKKLFGMIGFDSSTVIWPDTLGGEVMHLTRKTFAYTDPVTGEILNEYNGNPVEPIAYPYQLITYRMVDGKIYADVEQGVGERVQTIKSKDGMSVGSIGKDTMTVTASIFLDFPLPNGTQYQAWENYDFFIHVGSDIDEPHQMSWQRYGSLPPWAGSGKAIYHLRSWRVEREDEFPPKLHEWAKAVKPLWLRPPANLEEIRALQQGAEITGWGQ